MPYRELGVNLSKPEKSPTACLELVDMLLENEFGSDMSSNISNEKLLTTTTTPDLNIAKLDTSLERSKQQQQSLIKNQKKVISFFSCFKYLELFIVKVFHSWSVAF